MADGAYPAGNLVLDASGDLFGTAELGGGASGCGIGCGTVFELTPDSSLGWSETTVYVLQGAPDASEPYAGLTLDQTGNLYGTSLHGGPADNGTVFELMAPVGGSGVWSESVLYSFNSAVGQPQAGVVFDNAGNLYGATGQKTLGTSGTVFELSPSSGGLWNLSTIYAFSSDPSDTPWGTPIFSSSGNIYGTAAGKYCGAAYRLEGQSGSWKEAELDFFKNTKSPCSPQAALVFGKLGALYGTSVLGGTKNLGTVFGILQ
jgi:uncharacterized repeat protein (TIGR03803 family)